MPLTQDPKLVDRPDRAAIIAFMIIGAAISLWTIVAAVARIIDVTGNSPTTVSARFAETTVSAPIGDGGTPVALELSSAYLTAPLPTAAIWFLVLQQIVIAATIIIVVGGLLLLSRDVLRGKVFSKRNTALVATAGLVTIVGSVCATTLENLAAAELLLQIAGPSFPSVLLNVDPFIYLLAAFAAGLITLVFAVGEHLQRETEGLV